MSVTLTITARHPLQAATYEHRASSTDGSWHTFCSYNTGSWFHFKYLQFKTGTLCNAKKTPTTVEVLDTREKCGNRRTVWYDWIGYRYVALLFDCSLATTVKAIILLILLVVPVLLIIVMSYRQWWWQSILVVAVLLSMPPLCNAMMKFSDRRS